MTNIIDSIKSIKKQTDDQTIANDMLMSSKACTSGYYMGVLESTTPEMRSMYKAALTQTLDEYSALMELTINRDWLKPYQTLEQQLTDAYRQSEKVVPYHKG